MLGNSESTLSRITPPVRVQERSWLDSWRIAPATGTRYEVLDGIRGLAILLVVLCHVPYVNAERGATFQFIEQLIEAGRWGVPVFFALSGFLVSHPFWKRKLNGDSTACPPGYIRSRFSKIYPPLLLSILVLTPIYIARTDDKAFVGLAAQWLVGWPLIHPVSLDLNPVMWSLIVEVHFYMVLPLVFAATRRISPALCLWFITSALIVAPTGFRWWHLYHGRYFGFDSEINVYFPALLDAFALGVLLAGLDNMRLLRPAWSRLGHIGMALLVLTMPISAWFTLHPFADPQMQIEVFTWVVKLAAGLLLLYIADPQSRGSRFLRMKWLCWCGLISYEWYLFHQPIILWARESFGPAEGSIVKYVAIVGGSSLAGLLMAALTYRLVSMPFLKYARRPIDLRKQAPLHARAIS